MAASGQTETIHLFAAGSLKAALTDIAGDYETASGHTIVARFGASGLLKDEIVNGARADVFASANMDHPRALHDAGLSGPVTLFTRNKLCALVKAGLAVDSDSLLAVMLDPNISLGTSTPKADPSGDYAFEVFAKADAIKPGMRKLLEAKALRLTGSKDSALPPAGENVYGWHIAQGRADIFLTYCTNALAAMTDNPGQKCVMLPEALAVGADYGLTVTKDAPAGASAFARFILSPTGQATLARHGFAPIAA
ncbi:MAG: molybdate ABC transporter substrate-binding protein [Rhodopseudomonas sp.]|nr:molybdate ABC transporter substrate-binding protein [Rhodopseudomonas sp.]